MPVSIGCVEAHTHVVPQPSLEAMDTISVRSERRFGTNSPLRYPGGKASLTGFFAETIEALGLEKPTYVEPYAGGVGAGIALLRSGVVGHLVINDLDAAVYSFWSSVVNDTAAFAARVETVPLTLEEWDRQRAIYKRADARAPFELGFSFFYLNRTNRSGVLNAGVIGGRAQSGTYRIDARFNRSALVERFEALGALRSQITVTAHDGRQVFEKYAADPSAFLYVDPPYVDMGSSLYLNAFDHRDHEVLAKTINAAPNGNWILTYDDVELTRKLYSERYQRGFEIVYSAHRPGRTRELLVASDSVSKVLERL